MNIFIICLIVSFSITYIWDFVHFPEELADRIISLVTKGKINHIELKKPFGCSLCMTTWTTLIILLCLDPCWCWMSLIFGFITKYILYIIELADRIITLLFVLLERLLNKI